MIAQGGIVQRRHRFDQFALGVGQIEGKQLRFSPIGVIVRALLLRWASPALGPPFT
jgi:hypothetical protein